MKRIFLYVLCSLLVLKGAIYAEEFTTLDGEHYTGATLKRVEPDGLVICYRDGVAKLKFKSLSSEIQAKYKYNPDAEKDFLEKSHAEDVKRSQENQTPAQSTPIISSISSNSHQLLDKKIECATYNCEFLKKRIASIEQQISAERGAHNNIPSSASYTYTTSTRGSLGMAMGEVARGATFSSSSNIKYLEEELLKKKSELPIKEAILAKLLAEKYPPPPKPLPPPSFLEKYGRYLLWSLIGLTVIIFFLRKKN